jgi:NitT/TauT family transport system permease protein
VSTDPARLPYYAARSMLRMFAALGLSLVFTFVYVTRRVPLRLQDHPSFSSFK